jgi:hypothetical protein
MCRTCGNCSAEHTRTLDDAVDEAEALDFKM